MRRSIRRCSLTATMLVVLGGCASSPTLPSASSPTAVAQVSPITRSSAPFSTAPTSSPTAAASTAVPTAPPSVTATSTAAATPPQTPHATQPASTSSNGTIVYNNTGDGSLHALALATNTDVVLSNPSEPDNVLPWAVSPDGHRVAVTWGTGWGPTHGGAWEAQLWLVNIDGTEPRKLLDLHTLAQNDPTDYAGGDLRHAISWPTSPTLAWTPDGETIIAASSHEGQVDLYAVAVDGSGVRRLTDTPDIEFDIEVSPDAQDVAYASVGTFGTGGGWGSAAAWVQPLVGGERQSLIGPIVMHPPADPNGIAKPLMPSSIDVLGWTNNNGALVQAGDNRVGKSTFWLTTPGNEPRAVLEAGLAPSRSFAWDQQSGTLAVAMTTSAGNKAAPSTTLQLWSVQNDEVAELGAVTAAEPHWSPDGTALIACNDGAGEPTPIQLWRGGELRALEPTFCEQRAWAANGSFALSGNAPRDDAGPNGLPAVAGKVFAADGTLIRDLPVGTVVAGWQNDALLFFVPEDDGHWHLRRTVGNKDEAVGEPIAAPPFAPTLLPAP